MSAETWQLDTASTYSVPVGWYAAVGVPARANVVLMAALGVAAGFYRKFAADLAGRGFNVALMEQRGHGDSALRPSRRQDWGFAEVLDEDLPATLERVREKAPQLPLLLMGHSLGGHYAAIYAGLHAAQIDGVVMIATGSPWWRAFQGRTRRLVHQLTYLIPVAGLLLGYYPGERIGFGGREARTLMLDWRDLARSNRYSARGSRQDLEAGIAEYAGPVLAVRFADDPFAPQAAVEAVTGKFARADLVQRVLDAGQLGDKADHFRWARQASAVGQIVDDWQREKYHE